LLSADTESSIGIREKEERATSFDTQACPGGQAGRRSGAPAPAVLKSTSKLTDLRFAQSIDQVVDLLPLSL
jgi:hypothetical protein